MRMDLERCYSSLCTRTHNKEGGVSYRRDQPFIRYFKSWNLYGIKVPPFRSEGPCDRGGSQLRDENFDSCIQTAAMLMRSLKVLP